MFTVGCACVGWGGKAEDQLGFKSLHPSVGVRAKRAPKRQMIIGLRLCFLLLCFRISHVFILRSAVFYGGIYCLRVQP